MNSETPTLIYDGVHDNILQEPLLPTHLHLVANCQMSSGPHGPIFNSVKLTIPFHYCLVPSWTNIFSLTSNENGKILLLYFVSDDDVGLIEYENTAPGLIKSFVERFPTGELLKSLQDIWDKDKKHFPC